jgi:hypothetical protein
VSLKIYFDYFDSDLYTLVGFNNIQIARLAKLFKYNQKNENILVKNQAGKEFSNPGWCKPIDPDSDSWKVTDLSMATIQRLGVPERLLALSAVAKLNQIVHDFIIIKFLGSAECRAHSQIVHDFIDIMVAQHQENDPSVLETVNLPKSCGFINASMEFTKCLSTSEAVFVKSLVGADEHVLNKHLLYCALFLFAVSCSNLYYPKIGGSCLLGHRCPVLCHQERQNSWPENQSRRR